MKHKKLLLSIGLATASLTLSSQATVLLQTNFNAATTTAATANSNESKKLAGASTFAATAVTGISANEEITFTSNPTGQVFATNHLAGNMFAPDTKLNTSSWTATVQFTVQSGYKVSLTDIQFVANQLKNGGTRTNFPNRIINLDVQVDGATYGTQQVDAGKKPTAITFTDALTLAAGTYDIEIAVSNGAAGDIRFGMDDFKLNGTITTTSESGTPSKSGTPPGPAATAEPGAVLGLGGVTLILRQSK